MKFRLYLYVLLVAATGLMSATPAKPDKTVIYIVRHGEKDTTNPKNPDPELNDVGRERAKALAKELKNQKFDAVFSTQFKRTINTVAPVARKHQLAIEFYESKNPKELVKLINTQYRNRKVIIAGHSNTVLELVEAFGISRPVAALTEEDYDLLFKVTLKGGRAELQTTRYGAVHHVTPLSGE